MTDEKKDISNAALYGAGVFTTVAINAGKPVLWEKHWRRISENAARLEIDVSKFSEDAVLEKVLAEIRTQDLQSGRVRVTFHDERPADLWRFDESEVIADTRLSVIAATPKPIPDKLKLGVSPFSVNSRSPLNGVKSCNYLEQQLCIADARSRGFHEAVRVNEIGSVTTACMANVFWLKGETLFTPHLSTGCLAGTTREYVLESMECREVTVELKELDNADAIFLTSAGLGIVPVFEFNGKKLFDDHPILDLNKLFRPAEDLSEPPA